MRKLFNVTYDITMEESAAHGDSDERGFILESATLRDAIAELHATRTSRVDGVQAIEAETRAGGFVQVLNGMEYETGAYETRTLHFPWSGITESSVRRIAKLCGARVT